MAMLTRYKKTGGFIQLLKLIETCGPKKQEQLLTMVENEDPRWSRAIKDKMLSIEKIFSWDETVLAEVVVRVQELSLGVALHGLSDEDWAKASKMLSHSQIRRIEDFKNSKQPSPAEISTAYVKIIEEVREMISKKQLNPENFDKDIFVPEDIEEKLSNQAFSTTQTASSDSQATTSEGTVLDFSKAEQKPKAESTNSAQLQNEVAFLRKENAHLKQELNSLKNKMMQLKKIIAA